MNGCKIIHDENGLDGAWACCESNSTLVHREQECEYYVMRKNASEWPTCVHDDDFPECTCREAIAAACLTQNLAFDIIIEAKTMEKLDEL